MAIHSRIPYTLRRELGYIGEPPLSKEVGVSLVKDFQYLNCWQQTGQLFTFSQPALDYDHGDQSGSGSTYVDGNYYVILCSPPKEDTGSTRRYLQGAILPWATYVDFDHDGAFDTHPTVTWHFGGQADVIWESYGCSQIESIDPVNHAISQDAKLNWNNVIPLGQNGKFRYTPDAGGSFTYGRLHTRQIRTAALAIWAAPDWELTDEQAQFDQSKFAQGHGVRGYTTTDSLRSLGNVVHRLGTGTVTDDDIWQMGRRNCLFQWGHPQGLYRSASSYEYLSGMAKAYYKTPQRGLYNSTYTSSTFSADVAILTTVVGASAPDPASVKITSVTGAGTLIIDITSAGTAVSSGSLTLASSGDQIQISAKASAAGGSEITLHTISLWDKAGY